ncbi:MAG: GAF domain-containing protein, partial [Anaerolineales bacterium]
MVRRVFYHVLLSGNPKRSEMETLPDDGLESIPPRYLDALYSLNEIGAAINRLNSRTNVAEMLQRIAESAVQVVPGSSAVIYAYDTQNHSFDTTSRVAVGALVQAAFDDGPLPGGFGMRAINQQRRVISYEEQDLQIHPGIAATRANVLACFPMVVANQPMGLLYICLGQTRKFTRYELLVLDNFVNQAAMMFYHTR